MFLGEVACSSRLGVKGLMIHCSVQGLIKFSFFLPILLVSEIEKKWEKFTLKNQSFLYCGYMLDLFICA